MFISRMLRSLVVCAAAAFVSPLPGAAAADDAAQAQMQIREALTRWLSDFNSGNIQQRVPRRDARRLRRLRL